jgi:excisionase family DNA binding protein
MYTLYMDKDREFYTLPEVAELLQLSRQTVYRYIKSNELPAYKFGDGGQWRIRHEDLEEFIQRHRAGGRDG